MKAVDLSLDRRGQPEVLQGAGGKMRAVVECNLSAVRCAELLRYSVLGAPDRMETRATPNRRRVSTSKSFVLHFLFPYRLLGYDPNAMWLDHLYGEYLQTNAMNYLHCEAGVKNVMMQSPVVQIPPRKLFENLVPQEGFDAEDLL